ncbi:hypothetical protein [Streptomyces sp. SPB162]|uniref:hypothetical protein n=1 Tax=Streptomyces sp. SPB162 TaxID=2940560 RepID=UPI0024051443|nr:hypothetical protein [Streptomyces sp. SPB162]MDF9814794.1 hypothetical protein [Streptomyces sp. SPB162]
MTGRAPHVDLDSLVKERHLGKGGQGEVWAIKERKINKEWPIAYKEYSDFSLREADFAALEAMVEFIPSLDAAVGRWLAERSAWPVAIVDHAGRSRGFLMRQVPDDFTTELATAPGRQRIADFQFLLNDQQYIERIGITISDRQRLLLLKDLADLLARLHKLDVAVGDLSAKNLLFTLAPRPACFFIDCDAMRLRGRSVLDQAETPGWKVPDGEPLATAEGDRYKFTLLAIRLFLGEQEGTGTAQLAQVSNELAVLAGSGLSADPKDRPSMQDWGGALERAIADPQRDRPPRRISAPPADRPRAGIADRAGGTALLARSAARVASTASAVHAADRGPCQDRSVADATAARGFDIAGEGSRHRGGGARDPALHRLRHPSRRLR